MTCDWENEQDTVPRSLRGHHPTVSTIPSVFVRGELLFIGIGVDTTHDDTHHNTQYPNRMVSVSN
jgi:hypothetical protein